MTNLHTVEVKLGDKLSFAEGHSIAIHKGLDLKYGTGGGLARVNPDVNMGSRTRMDVLSMSKTITAAGIVRQLLANGLTPQEKIGGYLPSYWTVNSQVANLTFAHVLTHTGGLVGDQANFDQLQTLCASPPGGPVGTVSYQNINYSLLRVLLAYLNPLTSLNLQVFGQFGALRPWLSPLTALAYVSNIQTYILGPSGAASASVGPTDSLLDQAKWALQINEQAEWFTDNLGNLGDQHDPTNAFLTCGADRWNMSARDYGHFIAHLINGKLQPDPWPMMRDTRAPGIASPPPAYPDGDARLGVWRFEGSDGTGNYFGHNGGWSDAFTGWMAFPGDVNVVFFANSTHDEEKFDEQEKMILDSWLAS
jgi:CubicO group peptidase (beta-lactamase class C family)